ncbi:MAG: FAD-dependent oxidoreductase [Oscillospiraceae bacterium]|nr:FAD-dependent oxidoreductase [Oscillospiraceae bacterium]
MTYDKIIIGAGLYGLYAALFCGQRDQNVLVLEHDDAPFGRATYINQARVHMGYHYPRSLSTAVKCRGYFDRFNGDYGFCINKEFKKVYATSARFSWTSAEQFKKFCKDADIRCDEVPTEKYFKQGMCDGAFLTTEYTYDAQLLKKWFLEKIERLPKVKIMCGVSIKSIENDGSKYVITLENGNAYRTGFALNATYAGINQIHAMLGFPALKIKYELCEMIICKAEGKLVNSGITVMDGAFFSIMPFGKTGYHSLTSVTFTPHITSSERIPTFTCQSYSNGFCPPQRLGNCNVCPAKPESAWPYMSALARNYLKDEYGFTYVDSLYAIKPILKASEIDDSRPTVILRYSDKPRFISALSGKINTVYELDEELSL